MVISVAIATYNGEKYIEEQLLSILSQTTLPNEIIICDDCSTDSTVEIIKKILSSKNVYFEIIVNEINIGYTRNFLKAISLTKGDLIFISDQDDVWFKNKISTICDIFTKNPDKHVFINDTFLVDVNLNKTGQTKLHTIKKIFNNDSQFVAGCCTAIRGDLLKLFSPIPNDYSYDEWIHYLGSITDTRIVIDIPLQLYRRHGGNTSNVMYNSLQRQNYILYLLLLFKRVFNFDVDKKIKYLNRQLLATLFIKNVFMDDNLKNHFQNIIEIQKKINYKIQKINKELKLYNSKLFKFLFFKSPHF
jgi:glycosyltransferase involved in cell wall biosynthesis